MEVIVAAIVVCECVWYIGRVGERVVGLAKSVKKGWCKEGGWWYIVGWWKLMG